jgi:hypothetical protein
MFADVRDLLDEAKRAFDRIRCYCKYSLNGECIHPDYHKDFALADVCRIEHCPRCKW